MQRGAALPRVEALLDESRHEAAQEGLEVRAPRDERVAHAWSWLGLG